MLGLAFSFEMVARTHLETVRKKKLSSQRREAHLAEVSELPVHRSQATAAPPPFRM
jgi:hypothetical protein